MPQPGDEPPHAVVAGGAVAVVFGEILVNPHRLQALLDLRQNLFPERLAFAGRSVAWNACRAGGRVWLVLSRRGRTTVASVTSGGRIVRIVGPIPGGRVWLVLGLDAGEILPTVSRFTPRRAAISRLECPAL